MSLSKPRHLVIFSIKLDSVDLFRVITHFRLYAPNLSIVFPALFPYSKTAILVFYSRANI